MECQNSYLSNIQEHVSFYKTLFVDLNMSMLLVSVISQTIPKLVTKDENNLLFVFLLVWR